MATGNEVLTVFQSAAAVIPVSFLQEAIGVALKVIKVCEVGRIPPLKVGRQMIKISTRRHRLSEKRSKICKVGNIMITVVDHVTPKNEEVVKIAEGIEEDIKELLRCGL